MINLNYCEEVTELVLVELGIVREEFAGLIILLITISMLYVFLSFLYFKIKCRGMSCEMIGRIKDNSSKVVKKVHDLEDRLQELHIIDSKDHSHLKENVSKIDLSVSDVKSKVSELNGIILARGSVGSSSRRRIEHEDD